MSRTLNQTVVHNGVVYVAGTSESDITDASKIGADVWDGEATDDGGYESKTVKELEAEIASRNEGRDEADQIEPEGSKKADLIAALEADDES